MPRNFKELQAKMDPVSRVDNVRRVREELRRMAWSQCPAVESVPGKVSGAWVLKGTRMPVSAIFENLEAGREH